MDCLFKKVTQERKSEKAMGNGAAEGRFALGALRVHMNPLAVLGGVGKFQDAILRDHNHSVAGKSRPSNCFREFRFSISKGGIGVFMTTLTDISHKTTKGTAFLLEESTPQDIFTPEDLSEEHLAVGHMVDEFWANEVEPNLPAIREKKPGVAMAVLRNRWNWV